MAHGIVRIAHRGASAEAPENTLCALRRALEIGVDAIEVDVRLTQDGVPVLMHDATVDRTTDGRGPVSALSFEALRRLDAGRWKGEAFAGEPVPTLVEALKVVQGRAVLVIEVKHPTPIEPVLEAIAQAGAEDWALLASFEASALQGMRRLAPHLPTALIAGGPGPGASPLAQALAHLRRVAEVGASTLSLEWHRVAGPEFVAALHHRGVGLWCWTVNDPAAMRQLMDWGVDGLITDDPACLNEVLGR